MCAASRTRSKPQLSPCASKLGRPKNFALTSSDAPKTVRVTVRAPHLELRALGGPTLPLANPLTTTDADAPPVLNGALTAALDFSAIAKPTDTPQNVPIRVESTGEDVEVLGVKPASVSVVLERTK